MSPRSLGEIVRERRRQLGFRQETLANSIGISRTYLSQIESEKATNISLGILEKLAHGLGMQTSELTGGAKPEELYIPAPLKEFALQEDLPFEQVLELNAFAFRGKQPRTTEEWRKLYKALHDALGLEDEE